MDVKPRSLFGTLAVAVFVVAFPGSAAASNFGGCTDLAGTINVNVTADQFNTGAAGECSLREAIQGANDPLNVGARTINVPAGTYQLTIAGTDDTNAAGDLDVTNTMTIAGANARTTFLQAGSTTANGIDRVVDVRGTGNLSLTGATVRFGRLGDGAGLRVVAGGQLTVTDSTVTSNTGGNGGGIHNSGTLNLSRVTVSSNSTTGSNSLGGGIFTTTGTATLTNVTVSGNSVTGGGNPQGGGINAAGSATLTNVTITNNTASSGNVAGIRQTGGTVSLRNTIVAANNTGNNCGGAITNTANNLDSGTTCGFTTLNGSKSSANPALGALANNGGPTDTHSIPADPTVNPARDAGTAVSAPTIDQRSALRDGSPDMGAYETCGVSPTVTNPSLQSVTYGQSASFSAAASGRPTVQWEVSTDSGGSWNDVVGATTATLSFARPTVSQSGNLYRAKFTGTGCAGTVTTSSATLTVAAKNLTISGAVAQNKVYNADNVATVNFTGATLNGVESGDTVTIDSAGYSATFNNKNVGADKPVTVLGVALAGAQAGNYTVSQPAGLDADVTVRTVTVSGAVANDRDYDGTDVATVDFTGASLQNRASGEDASDVDFDASGYGATFDDKDVGDDKPVTVTGVVLTGTEALNYALTQPAGLDADVTERTVTIDGAVADNKVYDATDVATVDFTSASLQNRPPTEDASDVDFDASGYGATFDDKNVGDDKPVTVTGVVLTGTEASNYTLTQPSGLDADVTARNLTISGAVADNKVYDGDNSATVDYTNATVNNRAPGENATHVDLDLSADSATFDTKDVGADKPVTVTGVALQGTEATNYTVSQPTGLDADITQRTVTIDGAVANDRDYDGTDVATVDFTGASLQNRASGEDASDVDFDASGYGATFDDKNVGDDKPVTVTGVVLTGTEALNYALTQPAGLDADVTERTVTIDGAVADNTVYDGTDAATVDFTSASLQNRASGEDSADVDFDASGYGATFDDKNVGDDKPVTVTGVVLTGTEASNYALTQPTGLDADVTARNLTISGAVANNKVYDGDDVATVDYTGATVNNRAPGEDSTDVDLDLSGDSATFNNKNVGMNKPVTVTGVALQGTEATNYTVSQPSGLTANITARGVTISGAVANDRDYDGTDAATVDFTGASLQNRPPTEDASDVDFDASGYGATFDDKNVGDDKPVTVTGVTLTGTEVSNYSLTQPTGLDADVEQLDTTGSFTADDKTYDGTDAATTSSRTVTSEVSGDDVDLAGAATFDDKNVGVAKTVSIATPSLSGADAPNYNLTTVSTDSANISERNLTISGAVANNKVYDGDDIATVDYTSATVNNRAPGEDASDVDLDLSGDSATFNNKNVGTGKAVTVSGVALQGTEASNYTVSQPSGLTANITARGVTISGAVAANKTYDGDDPATVDFTGATLQNRAPGENATHVDFVSTNYAATFNNKNVGTDKPVAVTGVTLNGTEAANYSLTQPAGLDADITQLATNASFTAQDKVYDGTNAATVTGRTVTSGVSGDDVTLAGAATFANENVGTNKTVSIASPSLAGADAPNYNLGTVSTDTADITAKSVTGGFTAADKQYDGTTAAIVTNRSLSGAVAGDAVSLNGGTATFGNENVGTGKTVTLTGASLAGADVGNYTLAAGNPTDTADITAKSLTGSFTAADKVYDGNAGATATGRSVSGAVSGDDVSLSGGTASFANKAVGTDKTVTLSGASLVGADQTNYTLGSVSTAAADITQKSVTGSFTAADKDFDGTTAATITGRTLSGAVAGDLVGLVAGTATFADANPGVGKPVTGTGFALAGSDSGNYTLSSVGNTTATIRQRGPGSNEPPTKEELEQGAADKLGGDVKPVGGLGFGGSAFAFAPADQGGSLQATNQNLFVLGCIAACDVTAGKTLVLTGEAGGSAAATKKLKLKTQKLSLAAGELGVVKLKLSKKQKKAIKKAKKAKLVVKVTVVSGGKTVTDKKTYRVKRKSG